MIPDSASLYIAWIDPAHVRNANHQPLSLDGIAHYVDLMRGGGHAAPVVVNGDLSIRDGRHRWAAHIVLGRSRMRCVVIDCGPE